MLRFFEDRDMIVASIGLVNSVNDGTVDCNTVTLGFLKQQEEVKKWLLRLLLLFCVRSRCFLTGFTRMAGVSKNTVVIYGSVCFQKSDIPDSKSLDMVFETCRLSRTAFHLFTNLWRQRSRSQCKQRSYALA